MIEPLPDELQHLVASEGAAPVTTDAARAAVHAKLATTLGITTAAAASMAVAGEAAAASAAVAGTATVKSAAVVGAATLKSAVAAKIAGVVLAVGAVGTTVAVTRDRAPAAPAPIVEQTPPRTADAARKPAIRVEPIEATAAASEEAPTPDEATHDMPDETSRVDEPRAPENKSSPPRAKQAPRASEPRQAPRTQSQLLADASRALSLADAARALELIDEDTAAHRDGPLVEEREALRISALVATDRIDEAQAAARRLLARYPHTIHRGLAERVLAKEIP